jgi:hypothetical protein
MVEGYAQKRGIVLWHQEFSENRLTFTLKVGQVTEA